MCDYFGRVATSCFVTKPMPVCCASHVKESTSTRFLYCCIFTVVSILSVIFHTGGIAHWTAARVLDDTLLQFCGRFRTQEQCVRFVGYLAVYRFCIPLAIFHFLLMLLLIRNTDSQSWRGKIHNGLVFLTGTNSNPSLYSFWFWKCLFIVALWVMSIFFPSLDKATVAWMLMAVLGGIAFIYVQNVFLIDYAYEFNGTWFRQSSSKPIYKTLIFGTTVLLYVGSFAAYFVLWMIWGLQNKCILNAMIVYVNVCITALLLILSLLHPRIRDQKLWLPGAVTAAFATYLTWSAVLSQPKTVVLGVSVEYQAIRFFSFNSPRDQALSRDLALNRSGRLTANACLPSFVRVATALDHLSDLAAALGIIFVVGGSIVSSMRATLQAKRLGIRTRRQKIKEIIRRLVSEAQAEEEKKEGDENRRCVDAKTAEQSSTRPPVSCTCFGTERRTRRRRMGPLAFCIF
uniref:Serine incorporator 5 n=1 Tax=Mesocestoides corti TaxID=53468 RepID=A0A5K3EZ94_MESCO